MQGQGSATVKRHGKKFGVGLSELNCLLRL